MKSVIKKIFTSIISISLLSFTLFSCNNSKQLRKTEIKPYVFSNDYKSKIFSATVNGIDIPISVIPQVDEKEAAQIVKSYKKLPEYCWIESRYATAHYIHFAVDSTAKVHLKVNEPIKEITVYPKRTKTNVSIKNNIAEFVVNRNNSKYYLISVNKLPMFVIMLEKFEKNVPKVDHKKVVSLSSFISKKKISDYTEVFKKAIAELNGTGKTLYIPSGEYLTEEIKIINRENFNIYLDPQAIIKIKISPAGKNIPSAGILIKNSKNIRIYGLGCLDHQAYENFKNGRNDYHHGFPGYDYYFKFKDVMPNSIYLQSPLMLIYSQNITIDGLFIRNGRNYNVNSRHCDNITIRNVKVLTPAGCVAENTDGINIGSYRNFLIEDSFVYSNDDCFSMGHNLLPYDNRGEENLIVRNFVGWNPRAFGVRLGWASNTYNGDMLFQNCDFSGMDDGAMNIHKHSSTGKESSDSLCYGVVRFENCNFDDVNRYTRQMIEVQNVCMKRLEYINVSFDAASKIKSNIYGDKTKKIGKLLIKDMYINGEKVTPENMKENFDIKNVKEVIIE
jgi:hypothetical protein